MTKVIGEDLRRMHHEATGASVAMLRYHDFVPKPYLAFGAKLLRNGVDRRDAASATVAALQAAMHKRIGLFRTLVHTDHKMPGGTRRFSAAWRRLVRDAVVGRDCSEGAV